MYYFASDIHLGAGSPEEQRSTEQLFVEWLSEVSPDAEAIFLCGDIFDFWFEYKRVVPKGFVRTLSKIAQITASGTRVVFMAGNHDMWVRDYFKQEWGMEIYTTPTTFTLGGKRVHIAHGDNLNVKNDLWLKAINTTFRSKFIRKCFSTLIHPDLALRFGHWWSGISRSKHSGESIEIYQKAASHLKEYAMQHFERHHDDIYIFGHLHIALSEQQSIPQIIFMNDWSSNPHYITLSEDGVATLCPYKK